MSMNFDPSNAMVGAALARRPKLLLGSVRKVMNALPSVADTRDLQTLCRALEAAGEEMVEVASHNVEMASKTNNLPTRYLGIDSFNQLAGGIVAGAVLAVASNPTVAVRIVGFRTDDTFASDFNIQNIRIATLDIIVGDSPCPATMFTTGISLPPMSAPVLPAGAAAITQVQNIGGAARRFRGGFPIFKLTNPEC
jgi:hypothetical protein